MTRALSIHSGWGRAITKFSVMMATGGTLLASSTAFAEDPSLGSATSPDGKVRVDIVSLKRTEGETVTLRFQVVNNGNDTYGVIVDNAQLIDLIGRRTYRPGLTSPTCSIPVGQRLTCYAIYGAPPAGTQKLNVQFYERMDLITGVPLSEQ